MSDESMLELLVQAATLLGGLREAIERRAIKLDTRPGAVAQALLDSLPARSTYRDEAQLFADMWRGAT